MSINSVYIQSVAAVYPENPAENNRFAAKDPNYKEWIPDVGLRRRMSRIVKMGVAVGLQCLQGCEKSIDAIITATGLGCLADTEKFMRSIAEQNEMSLSPSSFIQSTFNTIGAQIALITNNKSCNTTYVHRVFSFETALLDAFLQLQSNDLNTILVGAADELTPTVFQILTRLGIGRNFPLGEGVSFFLLSRSETSNSIAQIIDISMFSGCFSEEELKKRQCELLEIHRIENAKIVSDNDFKRICGEYPTASAFGLWHVCTQFSEREYCLICNSFLNNHTSILIKRL